MVATIRTLRPVTRQQGIQIPNLLPTAQWIDSIALAAGVPSTYAAPTDSLGAKGMIYRITSNGGPIYGNFAGTATVPGTVTTGAASFMLRTDLGPVLLAAPLTGSSLSLLSPAAGIVTIEVWA